MARRKGSKKQVTPPPFISAFTPGTAPKPATAPQPITKVVDQVLLRGELIGLFNKLRLVYNVVHVCMDAAWSQNSFDTEITSVLRRYGTTQLEKQLLELTKIVESLGGITDFSPSDGFPARDFE